MGYRDAMIHGETNVGRGMVDDSEEDRLIEENRDLRNALAQAERERDEARGLLREARQPLHDHGWCLHHQADRTVYPKGHVDGDLIWGLVSQIDAHLRDTGE